MTTIHSILEELAASAIDNRDKGDLFERLMLRFFQTEPLYREKFNRVWRWNDWPDRQGKADTGVDLVAQEGDTGIIWAIQCKFFAPTYTLQKADIDSFFTASGKKPFQGRIIVSTTDKWSKHAEDALENQYVETQRISVQHLADSSIDWSRFSLANPEDLKRREKKTLRPHQTLAIAKVREGFAEADRGKLIMACGTGKTFTSLRLAEEMVPEGGRVLFLAPSIALVSQTLREWTAEATRSIRSFAVCSDVSVGRPKDSEDFRVHDLAFPATTDADRLHLAFGQAGSAASMNVVFSTYHSIKVISDAQKMGLPEFDLIVCDEAHRTTGAKLKGDDESAFVRVHDREFLKGRKRLYMTATPRLYDDSSKTKALEAEATIWSMDDEVVYGKEFHRLGFGEAVEKGLLTDYKVMVLAVDENMVRSNFQQQIAEDGELRLEDAVKIIGCWNGLAKRGAATEVMENVGSDVQPMRRAVAFARTIKDSQKIAKMFEDIVTQYRDAEEIDPGFLNCEVEHVDGTFSVLRRNERLAWLREETSPDDNTCRILTNAKCLSEGVDVPALDAVMFLNARDSDVDVVQSVGRVMRRAEGKQYGYIILPIGVPAGVPPEVALRDNKRYQIVWQVLQALRAHDDRFNSLINKIELNKKSPDQVQVIGVGGKKKSEKDEDEKEKTEQLVLPDLGDWRNAIYAKIVVKVGDRRYWETWAKDVAVIAEQNEERIRFALSKPDAYREAFDEFLASLRSNINPTISEDDAVDMLSQHLITKPVFEALFENYSFAEHNPVSQSMQLMIDMLDDSEFRAEMDKLGKFYDSVRSRVEGIDNADGKQRIIVELYDKFFRTAFPKTAERLGIVFTPIEVVDFILKSADDALKQEFGVGLADSGVEILDPFTGTGTFIVRLLQSGLISPEQARNKYGNELHANEILLLPYYIAAINIENAYHDLAGGEYRPFEGIVLTDTFQMTEGAGAFKDEMFTENNERVARQRAADIRVIVGNPPYSVGQSSQNDNNQNLRYSSLDSQIESTYAARSNAGLKRNLYDSYIRAFRWASNRLRDKGVICFVSNGAWIDSNSADGFRKCLVEEFTAVYVFNARGNARTSGEQRQKEAGNVFGGGSRTPISITLLVKNPDRERNGFVHYCDIGDYLSREQKLERIATEGSISGVIWQQITPNKAGDWTNQRGEELQTFMALGDKDGVEPITVFGNYSLGVVTNRDAWTINYSNRKVAANMSAMIEEFNRQSRRVAGVTLEELDAAIDADPSKISWTRALKADARKGKQYAFDSEKIVPTSYRPFCRQFLYFDRQLNEMVLQIPKIFPHRNTINQVIAISGIGSNYFSTFIVNSVPAMDLISKSQCYPRYLYPTQQGGGLFEILDSDLQHGVTAAAMAKFRAVYSDDSITQDDIFWYVYGILNCREFIDKYGADMKRQLPRVPFSGDFWAFSRAGNAMADLHVNYESVPPYRGLAVVRKSGASTRVQKMRFANKSDKSMIVYNSDITIPHIPLKAYEYQVNGRSAIEWIMDRYQVKTDPASGIVNDPNDWSDDPEYILNLLLRIITVSLETLKIVESMPPLNIRSA